MSSRDSPVFEITADVLLLAYQRGIFPMAESAADPQLHWIEPPARGILPLDRVYVPRRLARTVRQATFDVRVDTDFAGVIAGCAESKAGRKSTWINNRIVALYGELFERGYCHTVEVWRDGQLAGGLYGVAIGGAFFGESMFSRMRDASKVALVHLVARLIHGGFTLLDTQFVTDHLSQFGTIEVKKRLFQAQLANALERDGDFSRLSGDTPPRQLLDIIETATSIE